MDEIQTPLLDQIAIPQDEPWMVTCALCGTQIRGERSRLFWSTTPGNPGTYRTCKNELACEKRRAERREET